MQARLIQQDCEWGGSGAIHASMQSLLNWLHTRNSGTPSRGFCTGATEHQGQAAGTPACMHPVTHRHPQEQSRCSR